MKKLLLLALVSGSIMNAMQDNRPDLATFKEHINFATAVKSSIEDQMAQHALTALTRIQSYESLNRIIEQTRKDMEIADSLLLTKMRLQLCRIMNGCITLRDTVLTADDVNVNRDQTPPPFAL